MNKNKVKKALQEIAKNNGVSVSEVRREINIAIADAYSKNKEAWTDIPCKGKIPTAEEFILHMALVVIKK